MPALRPSGRLPAGRLLFIVLMSVWVAAPVLAQSSETREEFSEQARNIRSLWLGLQDQISGVRVKVSEDAYVGARFEDTDLHWFRTGIAFEGAVPILDQRGGFAMSLSTAVLVPDADGSTGIADLRGSPNDPFDEFLDSALRIGGRFELGYDFEAAFTTGLSARHEVGAEFEDSLAFGGSISLDYRRADWLRLRLGVGVGTGIDRDGFTVSPVFRLRVRPVQGVWLETDATSGRIEWDASSHLTLSLFGGIDSKRFLLAYRGETLDAGSIELRKSEVGVGLRMRVGSKLRIKIETAVVLGQRLSFVDENHQTIDALDTNEPSAALRIAFDWRPPLPAQAVPNPNEVR
jgi:hypothetical protein